MTTAVAKTSSSSNIKRQPAFYLSHGAGPIPYLHYIQEPKKQHSNQAFVIESCEYLGKCIERCQPKAICVISAHFERENPNIIYQESPPLYFDYYGFPPVSYELKYAAKCDMSISDYAYKLLCDAGFKNNVTLDKKRGWDHGVFIPLSIAYPKADIPLIQISLHKCSGSNSAKARADTAQKNLRLGSILSPLRDMGVMIIGSGSSYHAGGQKNAELYSQNFVSWLNGTLKNVHKSKNVLRKAVVDMRNWYQVSADGDKCHYREEHLLPLHVCLGTCVSVKEFDSWMSSNVNSGGNKNVNESMEQEANVNGCSGVDILSGKAMGTLHACFIFK